MWQQVILIGNVGREPTFEYTQPGGVARCSFSLAVNKRTGKGEERKEKTIWFNVTIWRERAEFASRLIKKGGRVMVVGELEEPRIYTSKQTNQPAVSLDLTARDFQLLDSRQGGAEGGAMSGHDEGGQDGGDLPF